MMNFLFPMLARAEDVVAVVPAVDTPLGDFFAQVVQVGASLGGVPWAAKVAIIITLILGSMKVGVLKTKVWSKIPDGVRPFLSPILGLVGGVLSLPTLTLASAFAYMSAGSGAIVFYELLDAMGVAFASNKIITGILGAVKGVVKK